MNRTVLVTGATGKTGRLVAAGLRERGVTVRAGSRQPAGADDVPFDWETEATFAPALDGVDALYLVAPTDRTDHLAAMRPLLEAAVARGVGPIVLLSAASLEEGDPMMGAVHAWLRANAPQWVVLRPSWFMQNFVIQHLPGILNEGCIYSATGDGRVAFIDASDIAAVAVQALVSPDIPSGEVILTGPAPLSYDDVAAAITRETGRKIRHCRLTVDELKERLHRLGLPDDYAHILADMDGAIARDGENRITDQVLRWTGRAPGTLASFIHAHRLMLSETVQG